MRAFKIGDMVIRHARGHREDEQYGEIAKCIDNNSLIGMIVVKTQYRREEFWSRSFVEHLEEFNQK